MYSPQKYSRNLDPFVEVAEKLFRKHWKLLKWNSDAESILDIGIGDGRMTKEVILPMVTKNLKEYVGADISEKMLASARKTIDLKMFKTVQIDIRTETLPLVMKNRFDHIISNFCLHSFPNIRQVLINIRDMLKPGGQLIFNVYEKTLADEVYDKFNQGKWMKYENYKAISPFYFAENPMNEYENMMKTVGFVDCHVFSEHFTPKLPEKSFEELTEAVNLRHPFVEEADKEEYLKDFVEECKRASTVNIVVDYNTGEKVFEMPFDITTVIASRSV